MKSSQVAYWGSGPISHFHLPALRANDIEVSKCFSRLPSKRLTDFCEKFQLKVSKSESDFIRDAQQQDGMIVALETKVIAEKLCLLENINNIFIEKPGSAHSRHLEALPENIKKSTRVLYNRRFYSTSKKLKEFVKKSKDGVDFNVIFPDTRDWYQTIVNVCHLFDLLMYVNEDFKPEIVSTFGSLQAVNRGYGFVAKFKNGNNLSFHNPWGAAFTAQILAYNGTETIRMQPFEVFEVANEMTVLEPDQSVPIRKYIPNFGNTTYVDADFKPGFKEMYESVHKVISGAECSVLGTIDQAISVLKFTEKLERDLSNG